MTNVLNSKSADTKKSFIHEQQNVSVVRKREMKCHSLRTTALQCFIMFVWLSVICPVSPSVFVACDHLFLYLHICLWFLGIRPEQLDCLNTYGAAILEMQVCIRDWLMKGWIFSQSQEKSLYSETFVFKDTVQFFLFFFLYMCRIVKPKLRHKLVA